jgi:hypothetical protein
MYVRAYVCIFIYHLSTLHYHGVLKHAAVIQIKFFAGDADG